MAAFKLVAIVAVCMVQSLAMVRTARGAQVGAVSARAQARPEVLALEGANSNSANTSKSDAALGQWDDASNATHTFVPDHDAHAARGHGLVRALKLVSVSLEQLQWDFSGYTYIGNGGCHAGNTQPSRYSATGRYRFSPAGCIDYCTKSAMCAGCHFVLGAKARCELFGNRFTSSPANGQWLTP